MGVLRGVTVGLAAAAALWGTAAHASGPGEPSPWYLDQFGGDRGDLESFYNGRVGIVMTTAPRSMLFISWRLLHQQKVGQAAGEALSVPCCGAGGADSFEAVQQWLKARSAIPGAPPVAAVRTERPSDSYVQTPNCFPDAFHLAGETLADRARRYGAASREVRAWLDAQDAVFAACSDPAAQLPPALSNAPAWLAFDRAYQQAALALYAGRNLEAADRFTAIAHEAGSPWRGSGLYLTARAQLRQALQDQSQASFARAEAALERLAAAPAGTFGQGEVRGLRGVIAYHARPKAYLAELIERLRRPEIDATAAIDFRDVVDLGAAQPTPPEALDWIATLKARPGVKPDDAFAPSSEIADLQATRRRALAHAMAWWAISHDPAWLIAALSLANPGEPEAGLLIRDARRVADGSPAWLSAQYHLIRLTPASAPADRTRHAIDAILTRENLSVSDRNVFMAQRAQVAAGLRDFLRFALRSRLCADQGGEGSAKNGPVRCVRWRWDGNDVQPQGVYDGVGDRGVTGFGEDARAIIDRAPLTTRLAISADPRLPRALRLDVALTSYGRAVGLQDNTAIDQAARQLVTLLPLMASDLRAVLGSKPGPDKRFAEFMVLAKVPGIRPDLAPRYVRPEGRRIADFQDHWADWILWAGATPQPPLAAYQIEGAGAELGWDGHPGTPDRLTDLSCLGECGRGAAPLRLPDFVASQQRAAMRERRGFLVLEARYGDKPQSYPAGGVAVWDEMLDYCRTHPGDPRTPEALYWLVHVGHFGGSHNHSGHRAFDLLHGRYPGSSWAKQTPYYFD